MSALKAFARSLPPGLALRDIWPLVPEDAWKSDPHWAAACALAACGRFDGKDYLTRYDDVKQSGMDPVFHFARYGFSEGRRFRLKNCIVRAAGSGRPKVSVLVPVYNNAPYLRECFDSILAQTLEEIEIIIINDGSTDPNAIAIMEEYAGRDARIRLIDKPNSGYGHSMNVGVDASRGKYIGIVESDDFIHPEMFACYYDLAEKYSLDFVKSDFCRFFGSGAGRIYEPVHLLRDPSWYDAVIDPWHDDEMQGYLPKHVVIWNGIYNAAFIKNNNIRFHESPGASFQDNGFWFQTFLRARRMLTTRRQLYMLRRDNSASSVFSRDKADAMLKEYNFIEKRLFVEPRVWIRFGKMYQTVRFESLLFNLWRVREEHRPQLVAQYRHAFAHGWINGEFDPCWLKENYDVALQIMQGIFNWNAWGAASISVIMPILKFGETTRKGISSALAGCEAGRIEILCLVSGLTAGEYGILREMAAKDPRLKLFWFDCLDWRQWRDTGKANAAGDYILFLMPDQGVTGREVAEMHGQMINRNLRIGIFAADASKETMRESPRSEDIAGSASFSGSMWRKDYLEKLAQSCARYESLNATAFARLGVAEAGGTLTMPGRPTASGELGMNAPMKAAERAHINARVRYAQNNNCPGNR